MLFFLSICLTASLTMVPKGEPQTEHVPDGGIRVWTGADHWANRLADWRQGGDALWCVEGRQRWPFRSLHRLTRAWNPGGGPGQVSVTLWPLESGAPRGEQAAGLCLGAGGREVHVLRSASVHQTPAADGGVLLMVQGDGRLVLRDFSQAGDSGGGGWVMSNRTKLADLPLLGSSEEQFPEGLQGKIQLRVSAEADGNGGVTVHALALNEGGVRLELTCHLPVESMDGSVGLLSHGGPEGSSKGHGFGPWTFSGAALSEHPERAIGPVHCVQYTVDRGLLKVTAQLPPLGDQDQEPWELVDLAMSGPERVLARSAWKQDSYTAHFRVPAWDMTRARDLGVVGTIDGKTSTYALHVTANPDPTKPLILGALSCVKSYTGGLAWNQSGLWFPHEDLVAAVQAAEPDLLFFAGDQIYEGDLTPAISSPMEDALLDYHGKWLRWCVSFGSLTRRLPTVTIPDDHDVYHGNVWGNGGVVEVAPEGRKLRGQDLGGYRMGVRFVNAVHQTQVAHLPDPADPTPLPNGISVYTTSLVHGGVSFAILGDRQWKSSPSIACPDGEIVNGWARAENFDPLTQGDPKGAQLLGARQLAFLEGWAADWPEEVGLKGVLSQTIFCNLATLPASAKHDGVVSSLRFADPGEYIPGDLRAADGDSNGWPRTPRDRALRVIRRGYAFHVAGDQHLASVVQYGVEADRDGPFAFCVPAVANTFPRRWFPEVEGRDRAPGAEPYLGSFTDGWGNLVRVHAVANPRRQGREPAGLHDRMPGWGLLRLDPVSGKVIFEGWPRWTKPNAPKSHMLPGWPVEFQALEQGPAPSAWLDPVKLEGCPRPVLQVIDEGTGRVLYTVRVGTSEVLRPWVFGPGSYTVRLGHSSGDLRTVAAGCLVED